ncbi:MAG: hypothetical protein MJB57_11405, partial [Gemmatimonadetes bacterium]|nr:hypothetical protein [Gemmatimonadota bacterium]
VENVEVLGVLVSDLPVLELSPDPPDNVILATAVAGEAELIVSGDKGHVLELREVEGIPVVTATDAVRHLGLSG